MKLKLMLNGLATYIPGAHPDAPKKAGATDNSRYCYSVWARHLINAHNHGLNTDPRVVAELGPGASLGIGLAALISGCEKYFAFDMVKHANTEMNLKVFEQLIQLFNNKTPIPGADEFPRLKPRLESYAFPEFIFNSRRMAKALDKNRLERIRSSIRCVSSPSSLISYMVPWYDPAVINPESVDIVYSQAVLEHVDELKDTYRTMHMWLKPEGHMSHQIDFKCHDCAAQWNGHWTYSDLGWKLIRGKRPYLINREPLSTHNRLLADSGFDIIHVQTEKQNSSLTTDKLAKRFQSITAQDMVTSSAFILAAKKQGAAKSRYRITDNMLHGSITNYQHKTSGRWEIHALKGTVPDNLIKVLASGNKPSLDHRFQKIRSSGNARVFAYLPDQGRQEECAYVKYYLFRSGLDFVKHLFRPGRGKRAFIASLMLIKEGFFAPEPLILMQKMAGPLRTRNILVTRGVTEALSFGEKIREVCSSPPDNYLSVKRNLISKLGDTVGRMHGRGIIHGDLRISNILVNNQAESIAFWFIDNERTRKYRRVPQRLVIKNLVQLNMFRPGISNTDRLRFMKIYSRQRGLTPEESRTMIKVVLEKTRMRMEKKALKNKMDHGGIN